LLTAYGAFARDGGLRTFLQEQLDRCAGASGKSPGAFSHPTVPSAHPYVLLNYQAPRDVATLAHGLAMAYQALAAPNGALMARLRSRSPRPPARFGEIHSVQAVGQRRQAATQGHARHQG
jgi:oligoendopeptidase F